GRGPAGEDEEGALEGVLGVLVVVQQVPADAKNQRAVPLHQGREGRLVPRRDEALQQLAVAELPDRLRVAQLVQVVQDHAGLAGGHDALVARARAVWEVVPGGKGPGLVFFRSAPAWRGGTGSAGHDGPAGASGVNDVSPRCPLVPKPSLGTRTKAAEKRH